MPPIALPHLPTLDAPTAPARGQHFYVGPFPFGASFTVTAVTGPSFRVLHQGRQVSHPLADWHVWLCARFAEGEVRIDGHPLRPPVPAPLANAWVGPTSVPAATLATTLPGSTGNLESPMDLAAREARLRRGVKDVLGNYRIHRKAAGPDGAVAFTVEGGSKPYTVTAHVDWSQPVACTCPDGQHQGRDAGACKHIVAVLLSHDDLRCQYLDLLL
ncbi:MAG: SWIM zinc finger family protein [Myxococcota bacterium]